LNPEAAVFLDFERIGKEKMNNKKWKNKMSKRLILLVSRNAGVVAALLLAVPFSALGRQGAQVDESKVQKVIYVDQQSANAVDTNDGSKDSPFKTIGRAVVLADACNASDIGVKILIAPGIYREAITLDRGRQTTSAPIIFEATEKGKTVVSGSEAWATWKRSNDGSRYVHPWPYKWGMAAIPEGWEDVVLKPIVRRCETVFADGRLLRQVMSPSELAENTFYVSEEEGRLSLCLAPGVTPETAAIEVGVRQQLFRAQARENIVLRGLTFVHAITPLQGEAVSFDDCSNILVEDCEFNWNNWSGLGFGGTEGITVRRSTANHNGAMGMTGGQLRSLLYEDDEASYNNWRGSWGGFTGWSVAGFKQLRIHDATYRRIKAVGNQTGAFWFDFDCSIVVIDGAYFAQNETRGIFIEASEGPVTVENSVFCFNGGPGVLSTNSKQVALTGDTFYENAGPQIQVTGQLDRPVSNWETKEKMKLNLEDWVLQDDTLVTSNANRALVDISGAAVERFTGSLISSRNLWYNPTDADVFRVSGLNLDLAHWEKISGQDLDSVFADPKLTDPDRSDFTPSADSPLKQRDEWVKRDVVRVGLGDLKEALLQEVKDNWNSPYPVALKARADQWTEISLRPYANRALTGQDGWIGEYPLENLTPGEKKIHAVPFQIIDPAANNGLAAIALRSAHVYQTRGRPLPGEVAVPISREATALYLLYGCAYATHKRTCEFQVIYEDGTRQTIGVLPLGKGSKDADVLNQLTSESNIQDWWPTMPQFDNDNAKKVMIVNPENALKSVRYLYTLQWVNPEPSKPIKELVMTADPREEASVQVFGISALLPLKEAGVETKVNRD
jgi:Right handed beta helix region/Protein of unknown function (DUF1565)